MAFINSQFENFKHTTENLLKAYTELEKRNEDLSKDLKQIKKELETSIKQLNDLEQYGRRDCIEISGIPQKKNENVEAQYCAILDIPVESKDIQACHRLGKRHDAPIICKFLNRKTATAFLAAKKHTKKPFRGEKLGFKVHPEYKIYINESLTKRNKDLMYKVRMKKQEITGNLYGLETEQFMLEKMKILNFSESTTKKTLGKWFSGILFSICFQIIMYHSVFTYIYFSAK